MAFYAKLSLNKWSYAVHVFGSGQPYTYVAM